MADKIMKTLNGYEVYDEYSRNKVAELTEQIVNETSIIENAIVDINDKINNLNTRYILTDADKQDIADLVENVTFYERPTIVSNIADMTDTSQQYILESTNTVWEYKASTVAETMIEQISGTIDNPFETGRLSSGAANGLNGYITTPYIDLTKFTSEFELHLKGITFSSSTPGSATASYLRYSQFDTSKSHLRTELTNASSFNTYWDGAVITDVGDGSVIISFTPPVTNKSIEVGYVRFSGYGTEVDANIYIIYTGERVSYSWVDTGIVYGSGVSNNTNSDKEIIDIIEFNLTNPSTKSFIESADYDDSDYSYTQVNNYTSSDYYRKDLPFPIFIEWENIDNMVQAVVTINTLSGILNTGMQQYYTNDNKIVIYNLIPNTTYYYKVYALCADSTKKLLKEGSFKTTSDRTRMLNIDGIQNVRDIGGYTNVDGLKVKYGLIFRGSAMDEAMSRILQITDNGKQEMISRIGIRTDIDLRYGHTESALGNGIDFINTTTGYENYTNAITNEIQKGNFKMLLESIVAQLTNNKPIYIHCQGGCDRTGTLIFLILGLLGVSESDLAKEYELSSLCPIGKKTRIRNSTQYNYSGMVDAIKKYAGNTIAEKFVAFAVECGVSTDTIASFKNLMLES